MNDATKRIGFFAATIAVVLLGDIVAGVLGAVVASLAMLFAPYLRIQLVGLPWDRRS